MLMGALVAWAAAAPAARGAAVFAASGALPAHGAGPAVDLSQADDESARVTRALKDRVTGAGAARGSGALDFRFPSVHIPAALFAPSGRIALSFRPRGPPAVTNFDLRRQAWQA